nr:MAG TPA: hypothetical protein [Caudoviricetes sp.]
MNMYQRKTAPVRAPKRSTHSPATDKKKRII